MKKLLALMLAVALALSLVACGGGGTGGTNTPSAGTETNTPTPDKEEVTIPGSYAPVGLLPGTDYEVNENGSYWNYCTYSGGLRLFFRPDRYPLRTYWDE